MTNNRLPFGIGDFLIELKEATFKGDSPGHPFRGNQFEGGSGAGGDISTNTDNWRKGSYSPKSWSEVEANKGDKLMLTGRDGENLMEMKVTKADPYRRFPTVEVTKIVNSNPKDREVAEHFLGRESGGEIHLVDADIKYFKPIRRASKK